MENENKAKECDAKHNIRDLQSLLQNDFDDQLIIVNYSVEKLVAPGENYISDILKISAKIQRSKDDPVEEHNFVAKTTANSQFSRDWTCLFRKESFMYNDIIPLYQRIELENGIDEKDTISNIVPKLIGYRMSLNPKIDVADKDAVILLENLKPRGYYVADRRFGMRFQHASLAIKALARFHALGIVTRRRHPVEFEAIKAVSLVWGFSTKVRAIAIGNLVTLMKREPRFRSYVERIEKIAERWLQADDSRRDELVRHEVWSTVAHNDFWTNNLMFHDDGATGIIDDVKIIDFQTYLFVDVFVDVTHFVSTSLEEEVKMNRLDELLDVYYETLIGVLRRMGLDDDDLKDFSREKFDERLREVAGNELLHSIFALIFVTADIPTDAEDRPNLFVELLACKGNDLFFEKLTNLLRIYEERDWLH